MSTRLNRRTFIGMASAALVMSGGRFPTRAQGWDLSADVVPVIRALGLSVRFSLDALDEGPLYLQVVHSVNPRIFFVWQPISQSVGEALFDIGPFGIPSGDTYLVSVVTALGERHFRSPVVLVDVPPQPGILN